VWAARAAHARGRVVPVLVGTRRAGEVIWWRFAAAALVAAGCRSA
jgi:hypothetical protein